MDRLTCCVLGAASSEAPTWIDLLAQSVFRRLLRIKSQDPLAPDDVTFWEPVMMMMPSVTKHWAMRVRFSVLSTDGDAITCSWKFLSLSAMMMMMSERFSIRL